VLGKDASVDDPDINAMTIEVARVVLAVHSVLVDAVESPRGVMLEDRGVHLSVRLDEFDTFIVLQELDFIELELCAETVQDSMEFDDVSGHIIHGRSAQAPPPGIAPELHELLDGLLTGVDPGLDVACRVLHADDEPVGVREADEEHDDRCLEAERMFGHAAGAVCCCSSCCCCGCWCCELGLCACGGCCSRCGCCGWS